jgi:hypothetical protein
MADVTGTALRDLGELLAKQNQQQSESIMKALATLAQVQSKTLEAVSQDHEIDMRFDDKGEIVGATKRLRAKPVLQ